MGMSSKAISWMPTISPGTTSMAMAAGVAPSLPVGASSGLGVGGASVPAVPARGCVGEGLLPVS